jgi:hypothetical protein
MLRLPRLRARQLRTLLLVKAIEEHDPAGDVLPFADRGNATLTALRGMSPGEIGRGSATALSKPAETILLRRAAELAAGLADRFPVVRRVARSPGSVFGASRALLVLTLAGGAFLSMLDGSRRIEIVAFPLLGVILWNLASYAVLLLMMLRGRRLDGEGAPLLARLYGRWVRWRTRARLHNAAAFHAPLARGLAAFATEWATVAQPQLLRRARALLHVCAAAVAVGLATGLYVRGLVLSYEAGWESTFLTAEQVRILLRVLYGAASALSAIPLPSTAGEVEALRWTRSGGVDAAPWIHLIALTAALFVVVPRAILALVAGATSWLAGRRLPHPPALIAYGRNVLGGIGAPAGEGIVRVTPYSYTPGNEATTGLTRILSAAIGGGVRLDLTEEVRYGGEEYFLHRLEEGLAGTSDFEVLAFSLGSTPERENHGMILETFRDSRRRLPGVPPLLVIVDESPFVARMRGDRSYEARLVERRTAWIDFVRRYGVGVCCIDLVREATSDPPDSEQAACMRATLLAQS